MCLIRKYKIHQITPILTDKELEIINFINSKINNLSELKSNNHPDSIFFMDKYNRWVLEENNKDKIIYVRYIGFWEVLSSKYDFSDDDKKTLIRFMLGIIHKRKIYTIKTHPRSIDYKFD